jgi:hypothetical protein
MALSADTVWEVRTTGDNANGGGFVAGASGTDYSQQDAAQVTYTDLAIDAATNTNVTSAATPFTASHVGNTLNVTGGTGFTTGRYRVVSVASNIATLDRAVGTTSSTGGTGKLGGALASLNTLASSMVASNRAFIKATGTYVQTATPAFTANNVWLFGYTTTRGDGGRASIQLSTNSGLAGISIGYGGVIENFDIDCNNLATSTGIVDTNVANTIRNVKVSNFTRFGLWLDSAMANVEFCEITGGGASSTAITGGSNLTFWGMHVHDNAGAGISSSASLSLAFSLIADNGGVGVSCRADANIKDNVFWSNGSHGLSISAAGVDGFRLKIKNNVFAENGGYGINSAVSLPAMPAYDGNAFYSNTSGARNGIDSTAGTYGVGAYTNTRDITLSADPFVDAANGNFSPNNAPGGGALLRGAAIPPNWPGAAIANHRDMGPVQHEDAGGSSGALMLSGGLSGGFDG